MKNLMIEYDAESVRWMGYHTALKSFFEAVAGLPNVPSNDEKGFGKNMKVIYATPSSAFTKHVMPMVNGLVQRPIISYYLSSEETVNEVAGSPFLINNFYYEKEGGGYIKRSFTRPLMKSLTYTCNVFTTKMSDCDYILTLLELNCNKFRPYSCRVNGKPTQFYLDNVETGTPTDYEGKKFISSSFTVTVPLATIAPVEIETDTDIIKTIYTYLSEDVIVIPDEMYSAVENPIKSDLGKYYEKIDSKYVPTADTEIEVGKTYYIKNEKYTVLSEYIKELETMYSVVENPVVEDLPLYYEFSDHEYRLTEDKNIIENKTYYIRNN